MVEMIYDIGNIVQHGQVDMELVIVPVQSQTEVFFPFPVTGDFVVHFEDEHGMVSVLFANKFYSEIIHT